MRSHVFSPINLLFFRWNPAQFDVVQKAKNRGKICISAAVGMNGNQKVPSRYFFLTFEIFAMVGVSSVNIVEFGEKRWLKEQV